MITDKQVEAAILELLAWGHVVHAQTVRAALEAAEKAAWRPISEAPKDGTPILAWCDHEADPYVEDRETGRLTLYAAHYEGLSHAQTGWHIVEWGGEFDDSTYEYAGASLPDWWFVAGSEFECAANPTHFRPLPKGPSDE